MARMDAVLTAPPARLRPAAHLSMDVCTPGWVIDPQRSGWSEQRSARLGVGGWLLSPLAASLSHSGSAVGTTQPLLGTAGDEGLPPLTVRRTTGPRWRWAERGKEGKRMPAVKKLHQS